jgi:hypothetical protein
VLGLRPANELAEEDKLLLPYSVYGFVLRSRRWGGHLKEHIHTLCASTDLFPVTLNISDLQEVKYENNFDELVLYVSIIHILPAFASVADKNTDLQDTRTLSKHLCEITLSLQRPEAKPPQKLERQWTLFEAKVCVHSKPTNRH